MAPVLLLLLFPATPILLLLRFLCRPRPVIIPISGRHIFISGGSSGIGLALARRAAAAGAARISLLARNKDKLDKAREDLLRLSATSLEVSVYSADVRDLDAVRAAIEAAGPVDVLVCNQGVFVPKELADQDMDEVKFMVDVNLMGTFHMIKAALPKMRGGGGPRSIAIMSSQAGQVGVYGYTAYSASKFGLRGLAEALQQEVISDNIHVTLIFPPDTDTPGLVEEQKNRPEITNIIAGSSHGMDADEVAQKALDGIKSGNFIVSCNFLGEMLSVATAGCSPQRSYLKAFIEIIGIGPMRFVGLCFQWNWYGLIADYHAKLKTGSKINRDAKKVT